MYLTDEEAEALRSASATTGRSQSELIREGVRRVTGGRSKRVFHSMGIGSTRGAEYEEVPTRWDPDELYEHVMGTPPPESRDADR